MDIVNGKCHSVDLRPRVQMPPFEVVCNSPLYYQPRQWKDGSELNIEQGVDEEPNINQTYPWRLVRSTASKCHQSNDP